MTVSFNSDKANNSYRIQGEILTATKAQSSVKSVLHMTSTTNQSKNYVRIRICGGAQSVCMYGDHVHFFLLIINLCKIMRDSKHRAITQTIHTNLISWVCSVTQATQLGTLVDPIYGVNRRCVPSKLISLPFLLQENDLESKPFVSVVLMFRSPTLM